MALTDSQILDSIDNAISAWSSPTSATDANGINSLTINSRSYTRNDIPALLKLRDIYAARVRIGTSGKMVLGQGVGIR